MKISLASRFRRLQTASAGVAVMLATITAGVTARAQTTYIYTGGTGGAWLQSTNWSGGAANKFPGVDLNASTTADGSATDIAQFNTTASVTNVGINFNTGSGTGSGSGQAGHASGQLTLAAIGFGGSSGGFTVGSSSSAGTLVLNGATFGTATNVILNNTSTGLLTIADLNSGTGSQTMALALGNANSVIQTTGTGGVTISSSITGSAKSLSYQATSTGVLTLSGANTFTGGFTLNSGTVALGVSSVVAGSAVTSGAFGTGTLTLNGGTVRSTAATTTGDVTINNNLSLSGGVTLGDTTNTGVLTFDNSGLTTKSAVLAANTTLTTNSAVSITDAVGGNFDLTKAGASTLTLGGANTFGGTFTVNAGTTNLIVPGALGGVSAVNVASGAKLQTTVSGLTGTIKTTAAVTLNGTLDVSGGTETVGSLSGTSTTASLVIGKDAAASGSFTVGDDNSTSYAGVIKDGTTGTGTTTFVKQGAGTLTLSGTNKYTGTTTVNAGKLLVASATGSATGTSAVTIGINGTLASGPGSATVNGVVTTNGRTSIIAPGATAASNTGTVGALTFNAGLNLNAGVTIDFDLGTTVAASDLINISGGTASSGGSPGFITFDFNNMGATGGTKYTLIDATGSTVSGFDPADFASLNVAGKFSVSGKTLFFTVAVPEPATVLGGALMVSLLGWNQRRRLRGVLAGR